MTEENKGFKNWEEVIIAFLEGKKEAAEEEYIKDKITQIKNYYKNQKYYSAQALEDFFDAKKNKKEKTQSSKDFQRQKLIKIFEFEEKPDELDQDKIKEGYQNKCKDISERYSPHAWISEASRNAGNVSFATHVIKLTHSKIDSPSFYDQIDSQKVDQLSTSSLMEKKVDGAVSGNQFAPTFQFLELELNGKKLATEFKDNRNKALEPFSKSNEELINWNRRFKKALSHEKLSSHFLAKQIYFPVSDESPINSGSYNLLCNVKSSSLAHAIYERIFNEQETEVKKLRNKEKYSKNSTGSFPDKARLSITASNHSNASQLNGKRGGKLYLFSTQPPTWLSQLKPPTYKKSLFDGNFAPQTAKIDIDYLREFLLRFERIDLSIKNPDRRKWVDNWVGNIIDELLFYATSIQSLPSGWSDTKDSKLKPEHRLFLDPYRDDEAFQAERKASNWQAVVCDDFARWLNRKLIGRDKKFTPQSAHRRMWIEQLEEPLREHNLTIEAGIKLQVEEKV